MAGDAVWVITQRGLSSLQLFTCRSHCIGRVLMRMMTIVLGLRSLLVTAVAGSCAPHELRGQQHNKEDDQKATHKSMLAVGSRDRSMARCMRGTCAGSASKGRGKGRSWQDSAAED